MGGGGGTKVEEKRVITPEERQLQALSVDVARQQLAAIQNQSAFQQALFGDIGFGTGGTALPAPIGGQAPSQDFVNPFANELQSAQSEVEALREQLDTAQFGIERIAPRTQLQQAEQRLASVQDQFNAAQRAQTTAPTPTPIGGQPSGLLSDFFSSLTGEREAAGQRAADIASIQDQLRQSELEAIQQGTAATPEQTRLIEEATGRALSAGEIDIERFQTEALGRLRSELAPSLGLRPTDTPVINRGDVVTAEALRQQGQLVQNLRGAQAQALLNFPLAAGAFQAGRTQFQQNLAQSAEEFQQALRQQAFQNRLGTISQISGQNLALAGVPFIGGQAVSGGATTRSSSGGGGGLGSTLSGIGGVLTGVGSLGLF